MGNMFDQDSPPPLAGQKRFRLIACEIFCRELCGLISRCEHIIDVEFLRKGLHDAGKEVMRATLQEHVTTAGKDKYDAILLAYGRCSDGVVGLRAGEIPLVIPRIHDCIAGFFGSRAGYDQYFADHPGSYFRTTGWTERNQYGDDSVMVQMGLDKSYQEYVAQYGKENADFILQSLGSWQQNYKYLTYIAMGSPLDERYLAVARQEAQSRNLELQVVSGNLRLLEALLSGLWGSDDFLVVPAGHEIVTQDEGLVLDCRKLS